MSDRDPATLDRSHVQSRLLVALAKRMGSPHGDLQSTLREITEAAAATLQVLRCGVWLYDESRSNLACVDLFDANTGEHSADLHLSADTSPRYFAALEHERAIAAVDACNDPRTSEFRDIYLKPHSITSMLDAPIRIRGQMIGMVCNEHCGEPRPWSADEMNLAGTFADFVGLAIEADEHQQQEVKAQRLEGQLRQAKKLKSMGLLAGGIAHDFNNLLVGILGNAALALQELADDAPLRPLLEDIRAASTRAAELAKEMLAYSGRATLTSAPVDLNAIIRETAQLLSATEPTTIDLELDDTSPAALGDPAGLQRVVMNLMTNAVEAIAASHGRVTIRTTRVSLPAYDVSGYLLGERLGPGEYIALAVADDGVGMDATAREHLFDPFFTTKTEGRGLGLAVVLGIVSSHRGALLVDSELEHGTRLTILLPASASAPKRPPAHAPSPAEPPQRSGTILIADDEALVRVVTRRILERGGYTVLEASDGREALDLFAAHRAELTAVVLDLTMPRVSGQEALSALRKLRPEMPVLLTSGYSHEALPPELVSEPRTAFLQKPFNPNTLLSALDKLGTRASRQATRASAGLRSRAKSSPS